MRQILTWMAKGLLGIVPILVTVYALWWVVTGIEALLAPAVDAVFGEGDYPPGTGLLLAAAVLVGAGVLIDVYVGRWLLQGIERVVDRLPLVKSFYGAVRDLLRFAVPTQDTQDVRRVVGWEPLPGVWMMGLVTGPPVAGLEQVTDDGERWVSVYFPMSYQVGGYTLALRERDLTVLDVSVEDAARSLLTAGVMRR